MINLTEHWKYLANMINETPMPEEYQSWKTDILCNDCLHKSQKTFIFMVTNVLNVTVLILIL